jgi:hypothetical protein
METAAIGLAIRKPQYPALAAANAHNSAVTKRNAQLLCIGGLSLKDAILKFLRWWSFCHLPLGMTFPSGGKAAVAHP